MFLQFYNHLYAATCTQLLLKTRFKGIVKLNWCFSRWTCIGCLQRESLWVLFVLSVLFWHYISIVYIQWIIRVDFFNLFTVFLFRCTLAISCLLLLKKMIHVISRRVFLEGQFLFMQKWLSRVSILNKFFFFSLIFWILA